MREILQRLVDEVGVRGSLLLTSEGMIMLSEVGPQLDSEAVAANAAVVLRLVRQALSELGMRPLEQFVCNAAFGKLVFLSVGDAYLAALLDPSIDVAYAMMAVRSAAARLRQALRM